MFDMGTGALEIFLRCLLVYAAVVVGLRIAGKRELGQMTVFDLVMILLIANAVQNAMTGPDFSVQGGVLAAFTLLLCNKLVGWARLHNAAWGRFVEGTPSVLIQDGQFVDPHLRKEGIDREQIEMAMREHGVAGADDVRLAVLETDGSISIVPKSSAVIRTKRHVRQIRH
jgi:uncharacterized membrane protein YcaP (DUF421 family)